MKILIITTLALGLSASAFAAYDPLQNEPGFYPEYLSQNEQSSSTTVTQPGVGAASKSIDAFEKSSLSTMTTESKNR